VYGPVWHLGACTAHARHILLGLLQLMSSFMSSAHSARPPMGVPLDGEAAQSSTPSRSLLQRLMDSLFFRTQRAIPSPHVLEETKRWDIPMGTEAKQVSKSSFKQM
jgi:hypothetical protein